MCVMCHIMESRSGAHLVSGQAFTKVKNSRWSDIVVAAPDFFEELYKDDSDISLSTWRHFAAIHEMDDAEGIQAFVNLCRRINTFSSGCVLPISAA